MSPTREDTEAFLRKKLDEDIEPDAMDEGLRADIMKIIPKKISEMYALVPSCPVSSWNNLTHERLHADSSLSLSASKQSSGRRQFIGGKKG